MKKITSILAAALMIGVGSCSKEVPFSPGGESSGFGRILTSSLALQLKEAQSRADNENSVDVGDFVVKFYNTADMETPVDTYIYSEMPDIVVLPANITYKVVAYLGENPDAAFDAPYYYGESAEFEVRVDDIISELEPITCTLGNVKVSINFDESLKSVMSDDSSVTVKVGESGALTFTKTTNKSGYFAYVEGSQTLAAEFKGVIDGVKTIETKTYEDVEPGNHYNITFRLHNPDASGTGNATAGGGEGDETKGIYVDAAVEIETLGDGNGVDVTPGSEIILDDESERPSEGKEEGSAPTVTPFRPLDEDGKEVEGRMVDFENVNDAEGLVCAFRVHSDSKEGFTAFTVDINSDKLTPEELSGIGLAQHLDIAETPEDMVEALQGLGFPTNVKGLKDAEFNITSFMPMLILLGSGEHTFKITISDEFGTTDIDLQIKC